MWEDTRKWTVSLEEALLWIMDWYFGQKQRIKAKNILMDLFILNM